MNKQVKEGSIMKSLLLKTKNQLKKSEFVMKMFEFKNFTFTYWGDVKDNLRFSMNSAARQDNNYKYQIRMLVHFLEKGMCYKELRPFGLGHVRNLLDILIKMNNSIINTYEFEIAISILARWKMIFLEHNWDGGPLHQEVTNYLFQYQPDLDLTGAKLIKLNQENIASTNNDQILSRVSARTYKAVDIPKDDLIYAIDCFRHAPSACNRQMCKLYRIVSDEGITVLNNSIYGIGGIDKTTLNYFVVTYNYAAVNGASERNQGMLNAGLASMNFVTGLHTRDIGSCILEWNNDRAQETIVKKKLRIPANEKIAVVISAGVYDSSYIAPKSYRQPIDDMYCEK